MNRLNGKTAIVTGAASGIGKATAIMFANEGAKVIVTDVADSGRATEEAIKESGGDAAFFQCDLRDKDSINDLVQFSIKTYGHIDILFNAAGILVNKPFLEHNDDDLMKLFEVNYRSIIWTMQGVLPFMAKRGKGSVINVSSVSAVRPETNAYYYGGFKAGIYKMTKDLAREFSPQGIRMNTILPGPIETNMTPEIFITDPAARQSLINTFCPVGRFGKPEDIAYCAVYLASDEAEFVTGASFAIDGGACITG
ncbi:SDR family oxidoreductase [Dehalobacter sp. DCM]|uniref:SDR family NAD(P)-dependent oxidoreductase n=1 Tax=Dehalobacter sp. DCM TaxID=2907827 RepID=UPI0030818BAF|nr:SDR family oxidoreductase [Dehalobacter sp. DCM]